MCSPHTAADKIESVERRAAWWTTRDYQQTSSVTTMLGNLNWLPLDQGRIYNLLVMMYKVTYDLVAILAYAYVIPNRRESKFIHPLAYEQIPISTNDYKFSFFLEQLFIGTPSQPALSTVAQICYAVCQEVHVSPLITRFCFYLLTILTLFSHCTKLSHTLCYLLFQLSPSRNTLLKSSYELNE